MSLGFDLPSAGYLKPKNSIKVSFYISEAPEYGQNIPLLINFYAVKYSNNRHESLVESSFIIPFATDNWNAYLSSYIYQEPIIENEAPIR